MGGSVMKPPVSRLAPVQWIRQNLFSTWYNTLLTLAVGWLLVTSVVPVFDWLIFGATFSGDGYSRTAATRSDRKAQTMCGRGTDR